MRLLAELTLTAAALRRTTAALRRNEGIRARTDARAWVMNRRARTRRLIELGGLVDKTGLEEAIAATEPDTRAVILGGLLQLADELQEPAPDSSRANRIAAWRERGRAALRAEPVAGSSTEAPA